MTANRVPVLITWDVDPDLWLPAEQRRWAVKTAIELCRERDIRATFYVTALPAFLHQSAWLTLPQQGHELGCHGLTHGLEENYDAMSVSRQRLYLKVGTSYLQALTGQPIRAFRSPRVKTSTVTQQLLVEQGYLSDSSVCSQRMDLVSSNLVNVDWLTAPRRPYHPHATNVYRRGALPIWQIPISATVLPFISTVMRVAGVAPLKLLFNQLYQEAKLTGKPIVYLAHPTEFLGKREQQWGKRWRSQLQAKYFKPSYIRAHGFNFRRMLYRYRGLDLLEMTKHFFDYMASFPNVTFMTMTEYTRRLNV